MILQLALAIWSAAQAHSPASPRPPILNQIACAPLGVAAPPAGGLRLLGGTVHGRLMFAPGDAVIVNAGTAQGVQPGQQFFVRRLIVDALQKQPKVGAFYGVHTAGWITVVESKDTMAIATVTHACDEILEGDFLEAYAEPALPPPPEAGTPDFANPARLIMADERRQTGSPGVVMLINRGTEQGVKAGQRLTLYRETLDGRGPIMDLGRATVLTAGPLTALIRVDSSHEALYLGDLVAIHRATPQ